MDVAEDRDQKAASVRAIMNLRDDSGGPVVIILATGSEVRGSKSGWGQWEFRVETV